MTRQRRNRQSRWFRAVARGGLALALGVGAASALAAADQIAPTGPYGPAKDIATLPRAVPVPAQPGARIEPLAKLGFSEGAEVQPILINLPTALRL
ncbi:MAG TPA: hypothetical protein VFA18_02115, partial [Gemmataceae bacterium]|nr:hypothetical protein [Gemmataceae bacterium]